MSDLGRGLAEFAGRGFIYAVIIAFVSGWVVIETVIKLAEYVGQHLHWVW